MAAPRPPVNSSSPYTSALDSRSTPTPSKIDKSMYSRPTHPDPQRSPDPTSPRPFSRSATRSSGLAPPSARNTTNKLHPSAPPYHSKPAAGSVETRTGARPSSSSSHPHRSPTNPTKNSSTTSVRPSQPPPVSAGDYPSISSSPGFTYPTLGVAQTRSGPQLPSTPLAQMSQPTPMLPRHSSAASTTARPSERTLPVSGGGAARSSTSGTPTQHYTPVPASASAQRRVEPHPLSSTNLASHSNAVSAATPMRTRSSTSTANPQTNILTNNIAAAAASSPRQNSSSTRAHSSNNRSSSTYFTPTPSSPGKAHMRANYAKPASSVASSEGSATQGLVARFNILRTSADPLDSLIESFKKLKQNASKSAPLISEESERFISVLTSAKHLISQTDMSRYSVCLQRLHKQVAELAKYVDKISMKLVVYSTLVYEIERNLMDMRKLLKPSTMNIEVKIVYFEKPDRRFEGSMKALEDNTRGLKSALDPKKR